MMIKIMKRPRILLIVAPSLFQCAKTAEAWGLVPGQIENFRNVTRAIQLRGITPGTPFIAVDRRLWGATPDGFELDTALDVVQRAGLVRIAHEDDLSNHRAYEGVPLRKVSS